MRANREHGEHGTENAGSCSGPNGEQERTIPDVIAKGKHKGASDGACVMEAVSYVAGEPWSDHPMCASPLATQVATALNDAIADDALRTELLRPLVPLLVGTRDGHDMQRSYIVLDWFVRVYVPAWLDLVPALRAHAALLRGLPPIDCAANLGDDVRAALSAMHQDVSAAWNTALDIAGDDVSDARTPPGAVAGVAASSMWNTAGSAVRAVEIADEMAAMQVEIADEMAAMQVDVRSPAAFAVWLAAFAAPAGGAWAAVSPTVLMLQASAASLLRRLCEVGQGA